MPSLWPGVWPVRRVGTVRPPTQPTRPLDLRDLAACSRAHCLPFFERQAVGACVHRDRVALEEVAFEHTQRERVQHSTLDRSLERPRAIGWIIPLAHKLI